MSDSMARSIEEALNPEQWEAVHRCDSHLLILAGAGTGKTRVITYKIAYLTGVVGVTPWNVMAVTFTNKAADEMMSRIARLCGGEVDWPFVGTFHRLGLRMVRRFADQLGLKSNLTIYDDEDQHSLIKRVMGELNLDPKVVPPRQAQGFIDDCKNHFRYPNDLTQEEWNGVKRHLSRIYDLYHKRLREANGVDFGDLICLPVALLRAHPEVKSYYQYHLKHILVDEFQDTNTAQYLLLKELASPQNLVSVVGDDDQSIYRWRGAEIENILEFPREFPGTHVVRLERNYRSTPTILEAAGAMIRHNQRRHEKSLKPVREGGDRVPIARATNEADEVRFVLGRIQKLQGRVPLKEMAVLYRTNAQSRPFEEQLRFASIPYRIYGGVKFYERSEVKDLLAYARLAVNPRDDLAFLRVLNAPPRGIGRATVDALVERSGMLGCSAHGAARSLLDDGSLRGKRGEALREYLQLLNRLAAELDGVPPGRCLELIALRSGLREHLEKEGTDEAEARLENMDALITAAAQFEAEHPRVVAEPGGFGGNPPDEAVTLAHFLDYVGLVSPNEVGEDRPQDTLSLMSVHSAKGLEFDTVFVTGVEENLFPHFNAKASTDQVEEERRLLYVAFTRAKNRLYLSHCATRAHFHEIRGAMPSRFLNEVPEALLDRGRPVGPLRRPGGGSTGTGQDTPGAARPAATGPRETFNLVEEPGPRVLHPAFGEGVVLKEEGFGERRRLTVRFRNVGTIKLPASHVKPA